MSRSPSSSTPRQPGLFDSAPASPPACAGLVVREVVCRSVLNGSVHYSFNCYTGCSHGCVYCYARYMQRFHPHDEAWGRFVDVKINAPEVLAREVRRLPPGPVFTCSACDGWQEIERHYGLTRRCCQVLLAAGFELNILTKSELVRRDLDIFRGHDVSLGVTLTTADEVQARLWEPGASSVAARLNVLREAKATGLRTTLMLGPLLPGISDTPQAMHRLLELASELAVDRIWFDVLNPRPMVWPSLQEFLRRHRPDLMGLYRAVLFDLEERARYVQRTGEQFRWIAAKLGLGDRLA